MKQCLLVIIVLCGLIKCDVLDLQGGKKFDGYLKNNSVVLVNFYSHNETQNDQFQQTFSDLESSLVDLDIKLGRVNGSAYSRTLDSYSVTYTPFITLFINETGFVYTKKDVESRTVSKLNDWVRQTLRPIYQNISSQSELDSLVQQYDVLVVLQTNTTLKKSSMRAFTNFAIENRPVRGVECVYQLDPTVNGTKVIMIKNYDHQQTQMDKRITFNNIIKFVRRSKMRIVPQLMYANYERVMNKIPIILIVVLKNKEDKKSNKILSILESLKHQLQNQVQMTYVYENQKAMMRELRKDVNTDLTIYSMLLQTFDQDGKRYYHFLQQNINSKMIMNNINKLKNKQLKEIHISEQIPKEQNPKRVQKVVYDNWEKSVMKFDRDTLVLFTVKWCKGCKEYKPIYNKLARDILAVNNNIQFVTYNPQYNHYVYSIKYYPTLVLYRPDKQPLEFPVELDLSRKTTIQFLKTNVGYEWQLLPGEIPIKEDL